MSAIWLITSHFLQMETVSATLEFCVFIIISQQNRGDANLKNNLWLMHYQDWVKNALSFGK